MITWRFRRLVVELLFISGIKQARASLFAGLVLPCRLRGAALACQGRAAP